jgi:hypothetical protein
MHTLATDRTAHRSSEPTCGAHTQSNTLVAVEALLLWPNGSSTNHSATWPIVAIVLDRPAASIPDAVRPLFELLDRPEQRSRVTVVRSRCQWTVLNALNGRRTVRKFSVRAYAPVNFEVDILLPARPLLGLPTHVLGQPTHGGATLALTTRQRAEQITDGIGFQNALRELVILNQAPPDDLIGGRRQAAA